MQALFEEQAQATPDADALMFGDETINYREFNRRANQLAHYLIAQGVGAERSRWHLPRSFAGVDRRGAGNLKAGGAYVPLDPAIPARAWLSCWKMRASLFC